VKGSRSQGWRRVFSGNRGVWLLALVAAVTTITSTVLAGVVVAAQDSRADDVPARPGLITVAVERRVIVNEITTRGDAVYADAVNLEIDVAAIDGPPVVTGRVPVVGSTLKAGMVALEVAGRPVIVLPGEIPAYRTMRVGMSGPDVKQLKAGLAGLGIDPGRTSSPVFDAATARAVDRLYARVGYETPQDEKETAEQVRTAEDAVRQADLAVIAAKRELRTAKAGATASDRAEQDGLVHAAERALATAVASGTRAQISDAKEALEVAKLRRKEALRPRDTQVEAATLAADRAAAASARRALADAKRAALTFLPVSEVAFLSQLPRRVDKVQAVRGRPLQGTAMSVSGATLAVRATLTGADAGRVKAGAKATVTLPDETDIGATITAVDRATSGTDRAATDESNTDDDRAKDTDAGGGQDSPDSDTQDRANAGATVVSLAPNAKRDQLVTLAGRNVKVVIPVESTSGKVLAVPVAALTAGAGGQSRVEVPTGTDDRTRLVEVRTGLAAGGFVEVAAKEGDLHEGDEVVVGR
jgi:hypothetical protein